MKVLITLDPNIGNDFKTFIGDAFETRISVRNILRGILVGAMILFAMFIALKLISLI